MSRRNKRDERDQWSRGRDQGTERDDQEMWEGGLGHRWGKEMPDWGRERNYGMERREGGAQGRQWEAERGRHWENWNDPYEGLGGRGWKEGWNDAMHRSEGPFSGVGPRSYKRSDSRIEEDINDRLTQHGMIDATEIEVSVQNGEVTLRGTVDRREAKRLAEDIAESVFGVKDVNNQIKVKQRSEWEEGKQENEPSGKRRAS